MERIWSFFENINAFCFAYDIDSQKVTYLNKKLRDYLNINSPAEVADKTCRDIIPADLLDKTADPTAGLTPGAFKEYRCYSDILKSRLSVHQTLLCEGGRRLGVYLGFIDRAPQSIADHQDIEAVINDGLRVALREPSPDASLNLTLKYFGTALSAERAYIYEQNADGIVNSYNWTADETAGGHSPAATEATLTACRQFLQNNRVLAVDNIETLRADAPDIYSLFKQRGVHSAAIVPLYDDDKVIGLCGLNNLPAHLLDYAANILKIMEHFIVAALKRRDLVRSLQEISFLDQLTQTGNRRAMEAYMDILPPDKPIAVLYCDVTGLKRVNDTQGHKAGDQLLIKTCNCLRYAFGEYKIFRWGGDEMLVICSDITQDKLAECLQKLQKALQENSVILAIGATWREQTGGNIDPLLTEAEELMYRDKSAYYKASGLDRRR